MRSRFIIVGILALAGLCGLCGTARAADTPEFEAYVIRQGQTLASIAEDYGIPVELLAKFNKMAVAQALTAGQVVLVPIITQLAPQSADYAAKPSADTPADNQVAGQLARVCIVQTQIRNRPEGGTVLFDCVVQGTDLLVIGQTEKSYAVLMSDGSTGWVDRKALAVSDTRMVVTRPTPPPLQSAGTQIIQPADRSANLAPMIQTAFEYLGIPYRLGGRLPDSVDCSLLVQTVFSRHGIRLPRTAAQQFRVGQQIEAADLQPGDRLYFYSRPGSGIIGHTGLYIGDGRFIHASSNRRKVAVDELSNQTYWKKYAGARR
ncbi:MAG: NlpC/P60 family protein [Armatimonadota bacterium]